MQEGNLAWKNVSKGNEVQSVRDFLSKQGCGIDYLNQKLSRLLSKEGRVVKFASVFLHNSPKVVGYQLRGKKRTVMTQCELGDLMTLFVYLAKDNSIADARALIFQAKRQMSGGQFVVTDETQRKLYDSAAGFTYASSTIQPAGTSRTLPRGPKRRRGLQYLFVDPTPVLTREIPADALAQTAIEYGQHLFQLFTNRTGLRIFSDNGTSWSKIIWEIVHKGAERLHETGVLQSSGLGGQKGLLNYFDSFEDTNIYHLSDSVDGEDQFGLQLVIVWDGDLDPPSDTSLGPLEWPPVDSTAESLLNFLLKADAVDVVGNFIERVRHGFSRGQLGFDIHFLMAAIEARGSRRTSMEDDLFQEMQSLIEDEIQTDNMIRIYDDKA